MAADDLDLDPIQADAVALLALVAGQDVEPGDGPGQPHGRLYHLRTAEAKAAEFGTRHQFDHLFSHANLQLVLAGIELTATHGLVYRLQYRWVRMT